MYLISDVITLGLATFESSTFLKKLKMLLHDPAIPILDIYLRELKAQGYKNLCTNFHNSIIQNSNLLKWKEPKRPTTNEIDKM